MASNLGRGCVDYYADTDVADYQEYNPGDPKFRSGDLGLAKFWFGAWVWEFEVEMNQNEIFIPAGSQIQAIKEYCGMKLIYHNGPVTPYPPVNWLPLIAVVLSIVSMGLSIFGLVMRW